MLKLSVWSQAQTFSLGRTKLPLHSFPFFCSHMSLLLKSHALFAHQCWVGEICSCCSHWQHLCPSGYWKKFWSSEIIATSGEDKEKQTNPFVMPKTILSLASQASKELLLSFFSACVILLDAPQMWVEMAWTAVYLQQDCQISYGSSWRWITPLCTTPRYLLKRRKSPLQLEIFSYRVALAAVCFLTYSALLWPSDLPLSHLLNPGIQGIFTYVKKSSLSPWLEFVREKYGKAKSIF